MQPTRSIFPALLTAVLCLLSARSLCSPISSAMRAEDKRLEKTVTVSSTYILLFDLLKELSAQTGVELTADTRDEASGVPLSVFLRKVRLGDALDALWSLNSYKGATWHWERDGKPEAYSYRLLRPLAARDFAERIRGEIQDRFERQADTLIAAAKATPEERKRMKGKDKADDTMMSDDRVLAAIGVFGGLSNELRQNILRGNAKVTLQANDLSPDQREFLTREAGLYNTPKPVPTWIRFETTEFPGAYSPALIMFLEGYGGQAYAGGAPLNNKYEAEMPLRWFLDGDLKTASIEKGQLARPDNWKPSQYEDARGLPRLPATPDEAAEYQRYRIAAQAWRWQQLSERAPLSLIAISPLEQSDPGEPRDQNVADFLERNDDQEHKWRDGILLLHRRTWFRDAPGVVPYRIVQAIQAKLKSDEGITLADQAEFAETRSGAQMERLGRSFPVFFSAAGMRDLFSLYRRYPEIGSSAGMPFRPETQEVLNAFAKHYFGHTNPDAAAVRILDRKHKISLPPNRTIELTLLSRTGERLAQVAFPYSSH